MLKSPLVGDVLTKASQHALRKVFNIHDRYLPPGPGKEEIPPLCSRSTKRTMGIPCIHIIKECVDMQRPLSLSQFHEQWYLYRHEYLPPVNPRMIVLEPHVEDKIRPLVENHRRLKECCRKKNHDDEDTGAGVYNLIVDQMASKRLRKHDVKGIVGTMNLMVTLGVDDEVLAVAVLSELTNAAMSPSNPPTTPIQRKRALDHSTLNTPSNPPPSGRPMRKRSAQTLYSPSGVTLTDLYTPANMENVELRRGVRNSLYLPP
ncbi:hypothetical protein V8E54_001595 [Elaphomyces granulatus]